MAIITGVVYEDSTFSIMSRFEVSGSNGVQADALSITVKAWDTNDFTSTVLSATPSASTVIYDTLQTDGRWDKDGTGYNWRYDVADSICVTAGRRYLFEAVITTSGGKLPPMLWEVECRETRSS